MLATGGQCVPLNTGGMRLNLKTAENLQVGLNLNEQLLHAFCHQVSSLTQKAEWDLTHTVGDANVQAPVGEQAVH